MKGCIYAITCIFYTWSAISGCLGSRSNGTDTGKMMVCYYTRGFLKASDVPDDLCTHIIYAFGVITPHGIVPQSSSDTQAYIDLVQLKKRNPSLKVLLSIQHDFSSVIDKGSSAISSFCSKVAPFLEKYGFDGIDLDWEYPKRNQRAAYMQFIECLGSALHTRSHLLSAALPNNHIRFDQGYNVQTLKQHMDFMTVMTYDFHMYLKGVDTTTGYNSPLSTPPHENKYLSTKGMLDYIISSGLPENKLLIGLAAYGRSWKLADPNSHGLHAAAIGRGDPGPYLHTKGIYVQGDVCMMKAKGASVVYDTMNGAQYLYKDSTWVSYDGLFSLKAKVSWLKSTNLRGVGLWALQLDDPEGFCRQGRFPLSSYVKSLLF